MGRRYSEFMQELYEENTTRREAMVHIEALKLEINQIGVDSTMLPNLRLTYAADELEATEEYLRVLTRKMNDQENSWGLEDT